MIKGILLDFDGTVGNTTKLILTSCRYATQLVMGKVMEDAFYCETFGLPLVKCVEHFADSPEQIEPMLKAYRAHNESHHDELIESFPGVKEAFVALQEMGIKLAIVTSKKEPMGRRGLRCLDLEQHVQAVIGCDCVEHGKPDAEPMLKGAAALGLAPEECLCVGDSYFDLQSGHNAKCAACVAVSYTSLNKEKFMEEGKPDFVIDDMRELIGLVEKINKKD